MMPLIEATIGAGRTPDQIRKLIQELHEATVRALDAPPEAVRVIIRELPLTHWASGGVTIAERRAAQHPDNWPDVTD
jgi:4-oxalocrotonate tautomerase